MYVVQRARARTHRLHVDLADHLLGVLVAHVLEVPVLRRLLALLRHQLHNVWLMTYINYNGRFTQDTLQVKAQTNGPLITPVPFLNMMEDISVPTALDQHTQESMDPVEVHRDYFDNQ